MQDVAVAAGVSIATASRALSGSRPVTRAAEAAVLEAADRLGYRTNTVARALRTQATRTVGLVVPYIANPFCPLLVQALELELERSGRELFLCDSHGSPEREAARIRALVERMVDGLLVIPCHRTRSRAALEDAAARLPVVQVDRHVEGSAGDFAGVDDERGLALVFEHLRARSCRSFAFVSAEPASSSAHLRLDAFQRAVRAGSATGSAVLLGEFTVDWGREAARRLLATGPLPDAVVCGADIVAIGVLTELREAGVRIPDDVLVTGFDDVGFAELALPGLTTVRQPVDRIAAEAVRLLDARLRDADAPSQRSVLAPVLVERASTRRD